MFVSANNSASSPVAVVINFPLLVHSFLNLSTPFRISPYLPRLLTASRSIFQLQTPFQTSPLLERNFSYFFLSLKFFSPWRRAIALHRFVFSFIFSSLFRCVLLFVSMHLRWQWQKEKKKRWIFELPVKTSLNELLHKNFIRLSSEFHSVSLLI